MSGLTGNISQIIGPVVDVHFELGDDQSLQLPAIHEAMSVIRNDGRELIVEVQQHIGEAIVITKCFKEYMVFVLKQKKIYKHI